MSHSRLTEVSDAPTGVADDGGGEDGGLVALPGLVPGAPAVQALEVHVLQGAVQHGQVMHVLGPKSHGLGEKTCMHRVGSGRDSSFPSHLFAVRIVDLHVYEVLYLLDAVLDVLGGAGGDERMHGLVQGIELLSCALRIITMNLAHKHYY